MVSFFNRRENRVYAEDSRWLTQNGLKFDIFTRQLFYFHVFYTYYMKIKK